jgi:hypothetical protein
VIINTQAAITFAFTRLIGAGTDIYIMVLAAFYHNISSFFTPLEIATYSDKILKFGNRL